jgi:hypothetical protein
MSQKLEKVCACSVYIICPLVLSARFICLSWLHVFRLLSLHNLFASSMYSYMFFPACSICNILHVSIAFFPPIYFVCMFFLLFCLHNLSASSGCIVCVGVQSAYMHVCIICLNVLSACHIWMFAACFEGNFCLHVLCAVLSPSFFCSGCFVCIPVYSMQVFSAC